MLKEFQQYILEHSLARYDQKLILAVSGGIDSMVMLHLFMQSNKFTFAIAHCNFGLRGAESDKDQQFIRNIARQIGKEFYTVNFDTRQYASEKGLSIQMAARELRYDWFSNLAKELQYDRIAVAHNRDDIVETIILNLTRGTGIQGVTGIKPSTGIVIRPLLFAGRDSIEEYAGNNEIKFREDLSNTDTKYKRNLIRHQVIPLLKKLNPSIRETLVHEAEIFSSTWEVYKQDLDSLQKACISKTKDRYLISIEKLIELKITPPLLFDMLSKFEFSYPVIKDIFNAFHAESGRRYYSPDYVLLKDREFFIVEKNYESAAESSFQIEDDINELTYPVQLTFRKFTRPAGYSWSKKDSIACLDLDKISFPLTLRHWQEGDFFYPLGLGGRKKISDFFTDSKTDLLEKERTWLLVSGMDIIWIVGKRIDDRFKIRPETKNILKLEIMD